MSLNKQRNSNCYTTSPPSSVEGDGEGNSGDSPRTLLLRYTHDSHACIQELQSLVELTSKVALGDDPHRDFLGPADNAGHTRLRTPKAGRSPGPHERRHGPSGPARKGRYAARHFVAEPLLANRRGVRHPVLP